MQHHIRTIINRFLENVLLLNETKKNVILHLFMEGVSTVSWNAFSKIDTSGQGLCLFSYTVRTVNKCMFKVCLAGPDNI